MSCQLKDSIINKQEIVLNHYSDHNSFIPSTNLHNGYFKYLLVARFSYSALNFRLRVKYIWVFVLFPSQFTLEKRKRKYLFYTLIYCSH